jgi:hypothetical protein
VVLAACAEVVDAAAAPSIRFFGQLLEPLEKVPFSPKYSHPPAWLYWQTTSSPSPPVELRALPTLSVPGQTSAPETALWHSARND